MVFALAGGSAITRGFGTIPRSFPGRSARQGARPAPQLSRGAALWCPCVEKHLIETFGTIGLLVTIFAESSLIFFLPGDTLLFTAGLLASQGELNIAVVLIGSFVAAVAGNQVAYVVGARLGPSLFKPDSKLFKMEYVHPSEEDF